MPKQSKTKFNIPEYVQKNHADLVKLVLNSESMPDSERQYWFDLLPVMTPEQVQRLRDILNNEKKQLAELEKEYKDTMKDLAGDDLSKRPLQPKKRKEKRVKIKTAEAKYEVSEKEKEAELLKQLENL